MVSARLPDFLIIGAAKSGTSALYQYLKQHPQIYMSTPKELRYFLVEGNIPPLNGPGDREDYINVPMTWEAYLSHFAEAGSKICGEASPAYLYVPEVPFRIARRLPHVKLVVILRHPVERAWSNYLHMRRVGRETLSFEEALEREEERIRLGWDWFWHYAQQGRYGEQLERYFEIFDRSQILVLMYEDLKQNPERLMHTLLSFLGVSTDHIPTVFPRHNMTGQPRSRTLFQIWWNFYTRPNPVKRMIQRVIPKGIRAQVGTTITAWLLQRPRLSPQTYARLLEYYREDILKLQDLIQRDLSHWLNPTPANR